MSPSDEAWISYMLYRERKMVFVPYALEGLDRKSYGREVPLCG